MRAKILAALSAVVFVANAQAAETHQVIAGIAWNDSAKTVKAALSDVCRSVHVMKASPVRFPLAAKTEQHIRCEELTLTSGLIDAAVFVVADDQLKMAELRGGAVKALALDTRERLGRYLTYDVYDGAEVFAKAEEDAVWLLSEDALHPNLFTWSNPYLQAGKGKPPAYKASAALPAFLAFGGDLEALKPRFEAECAQMDVEPIEEPWLPDGPETQTQINCFGFEYAGFPRKFEAVFGDGKLQLVWILTGKGEEARVRHALIEEFGPADSVSSKWEIFEGGRIGLSKDKPEILVLSEELVPYYVDEFTAE